MSNFDDFESQFEQEPSSFASTIDRYFQRFEDNIWYFYSAAMIAIMVASLVVEPSSSIEEKFETCLESRTSADYAEALLDPDNHAYMDFTVEDKALVLDCWREVNFSSSVVSQISK